jgi:hypothetical protein
LMDDINLIHKATAEEVDKGLAEVVSLSELDRRFGRGCWRADERFIVHQGTKDRPCENCKASSKNRTFHSPEKIQHAPADSAAAVGRFFYKASRVNDWDFEWAMGASEDDEPNAYRSSAARQPQYTVFMFIDPTVDTSTGASPLRAAIPCGLNFGLSGAVIQYCRKPALVTTFLRRFLMVAVISYVDDDQVPEPDFARGPEDLDAPPGPSRFPASGQSMLWAAYDLLGFHPLKVEKSEPWSIGPCPFVGVTTDFSRMASDEVILLAIKESTRAKALVMITQAITSGTIDPQQAATLYGKLRWILCLGRLGVAALRALKTRQYSCAPPSTSAAAGSVTWGLDEDLVDSLSYVYKLLTSSPFPAVLRCAESTARPILVWSDASWKVLTGWPLGKGQIGWVVKFPRPDSSYDVVYAESVVPDNILQVLNSLREQKTFIHPLEFIGIMAPYLCPEIAERFRGKSVLHFGDNEAANAIAINGSSKAADLNRLAHIHHLRLSEKDIRTWISYVPSAANFADDPSRDECTALERDHDARRVPFTFPDLMGRLGFS